MSEATKGWYRTINVIGKAKCITEDELSKLDCNGRKCRNVQQSVGKRTSLIHFTYC